MQSDLSGWEIDAAGDRSTLDGGRQRAGVKGHVWTEVTSGLGSVNTGLSAQVSGCPSPGESL